MSNANAHKNFTSCGDQNAEQLLKRVLSEIGDALSGTGLFVALGGSYGRGDGGVRQDQENGILYNDLDFFVFAENPSADAGKLLKELAEKYEKELKVDVDFSRTMSIDDIRNNAARLMMQELKRGYHPVCGKDLLEKHLPELPAEQLPFSEACRLLVNRGMGLLLAGEKIAQQSTGTDFILRNIYKAILGAGDAMLISEGNYCWMIAERLELIEKSDLPDNWKAFYREAVDFKRAPHRQTKTDMIAFWNSVRDFFQFSMRRCAGDSNLQHGFFISCCKSGESSLKNYIKYCIKSRSLQLCDWKYYTIPPVAALAAEVYPALNQMPGKIDLNGKLYQHWLIFN